MIRSSYSSSLICILINLQSCYVCGNDMASGGSITHLVSVVAGIGIRKYVKT